jgi:hypothetical protein
MLFFKALNIVFQPDLGNTCTDFSTCHTSTIDYVANEHLASAYQQSLPFRIVSAYLQPGGTDSTG